MNPFLQAEVNRYLDRTGMADGIRRVREEFGLSDETATRVYNEWARQQGLSADKGATEGTVEDKTDIRLLQKVISEWADEVFPNRTSWEALTKLVMHEIPELVGKPMDPEEYADAVILILDIATLNNIDVAQAVLSKMRKNRKRKWKLDPSTGLHQHIEEDDE